MKTAEERVVAADQFLMDRYEEIVASMSAKRFMYPRVISVSGCL